MCGLVREGWFAAGGRVITQPRFSEVAPWLCWGLWGRRKREGWGRETRGRSEENKNTCRRRLTLRSSFFRSPTRQTHTQPAPLSPNPHPHTMATDAPVTFNDLPDDMLHEIFGHVFAEKEIAVVKPKDTPQGTHVRPALRVPPLAPYSRLGAADRCVCQR